MNEIKIKQNCIKQIIGLMTKKDKLYASLAIIFTILSAIADLMNPFVFSKILNNIQGDNSLTSGHNTPTVDDIQWYLFGIMCGLSLLSLCFAILYTMFSVKLSVTLSSNLRLKLFNHIQYLSSKNIDNFGSSSLLTRVTSDIVNVQTMTLNMFSIAVKSVCFVIGGFILSIIQVATFKGDPIIWTVTSAYALIIVFVVVISVLMKKGMPKFKKTREAIDTNNELISENILGNRMIRAFNLEEVQTKKYNAGNANLKRLSISAEGFFCVIMPLLFFVINLATVLIIVFAGVYAIKAPKDQIEENFKLIGIVMSFIQYFMLIMVGLSLVGMFAFTFSRGKVSGDRIFEVINTEPLIKSNSNTELVKKGNIQFKNVSFSYYDGEQRKDVLKNINLNIKQGEWLGIIGQTGSGKSTLVNLITRLYDVNDGEVLVSDVNVKDLDLDSLRENVSVSIQEKILLHGTIKSNILAGKPNATDKEIESAAKWAEAYEFISKKDLGFDAIVEQRGSNLSGGQKQRVSIARALIKKPKILIFDDSTSALDAITERKIIDNLNKHFKGVTVVFVSQKVRSIQTCDQIIVLDNGKIVQNGKHEELLKNKNGIYKKIFDSQNMSVEG